MPLKKQKNLVRFALQYPENWHSFTSDKETVNSVCACANLGFIKINEFSQFKLKNKDSATRWLKSF